MKAIEPKTSQNNRYHFHAKVKQQKKSKEKVASLPKEPKKRTTTKKSNTEVEKKSKKTTKKKQSNSWIKTGLHSFKCPECKKDQIIMYPLQEIFNYCPYCGKKLKNDFSKPIIL